MNTPKVHLWELIHSLIPAEKRYFKTHFAATGSQLTHLFDILNGQEVYVEDQAREQLGVAASQYKVLKHQLQELLMKSLVANNGKRNIKSKVRLGLEEVDLLLEREHFGEAIKRLRRLEDQCAQFGLTLYQYEVRERLHEIQHLELDFSDPEADRHYQHLLRLQRILAQKQELSAIQRKLDDWNPFTPERHRVLEELWHSLSRMEAEYLDFGSSMAWTQSMAVCNELLGDEEAAAHDREQVLESFALAPGLKDQLPLSYLQALKHVASPARSLPEIKFVNEIAEQARHVIARYPQYSPHYIYFLWARLQTYYLHHDWERILLELEGSCLEHLHNYELGGSRTALKIYIILAITYLIQGNYPQGAHYLEAYHLGKITKEESLNCAVSLLELILLVERGDSNGLADRLKSLRQKQRHEARQDFSPLYNWHLELFQEMTRRPFEQAEIAAGALLEIVNFPYDPIMYYYSFFNIEGWLQSVAARRKWKDTFLS